MNEQERLRILGEALSLIEAEPTRERRIAALGCFVEAVKTGKMLPQDVAKLKRYEA